MISINTVLTQLIKNVVFLIVSHSLTDQLDVNRTSEVKSFVDS